MLLFLPIVGPVQECTAHFVLPLIDSLILYNGRFFSPQSVQTLEIIRFSRKQIKTLLHFQIYFIKCVQLKCLLIFLVLFHCVDVCQEQVCTFAN